MAPTTPLYFIVDQGSSNTDSITMSFIKGYNTLDSVYCYEPIPAGLSKAEEKYIIGLQACTWTEFMEKPETVESMVYPRICALSEVQWLDKSKKDLPDFKEPVTATSFKTRQPQCKLCKAQILILENEKVSNNFCLNILFINTVL